MTKVEILAAFETEVNVLNTQVAKPDTAVSVYFINAAIDKFVKTRYSGLNVKGTGFEANQQRSDDLRTLIKTYQQQFILHPNTYYSVTLPSDYMYALGEETGIFSTTDSCWPLIDDVPVVKPTDVLEATIENYNKLIENSLSEYHYKNRYAKPLRLRINDTVQLFTDGKYKVDYYKLTYLSKPITYSLVNPFDTYESLPEHTHQEICKMAAQLYIENQMPQANRYETISNEVNAMS
jgi:hypothetical protein